MIQSENFEFPEPISDLNVVIGAGLMGHSIAGVFAGDGASVTVHDVDPRALEAVPEKLGKQPAVADSVARLLGSVGKVPVHVRKDTPGFIGNRLQHVMWREALSLVEAGVCDAETIDLVVRNSFGLRLPVMGPMENADYVGLDLTAAVHIYLFPTLNNDSKASPVVTALIEAGHLGAKTGSGLLQRDSNARAAAAERSEQHLLKPVSGPS